MDFKGFTLKGLCNEKHTIIRYDGTSGLFILSLVGGPEIEGGPNLRRLTEFAFMDGALTVVHDYDLRRAP